MNLNAIQMRSKIDTIIDRVRSPRFSDESYYDDINEAIEEILEDRTHNIKDPKTYSLESAQRVADELYTLVTDPPDTGAPTGNTVSFPSDYYGYLILFATIDTVQQYCRPTSHGVLGPLRSHSFRKPTNVKPYFIQNAGGLDVERATTGSFTAYELHYLKNPAVVTIGQESDKIVTGGTLTNTVTYLAYDESVYAGITYIPGATITGDGSALNSGTVIPTSVITSCDLPERIHIEVCQLAARKLKKRVENYNSAKAIELEERKS